MKIVNELMDGLDPKYYEDISGYLKKLDWENAVPDGERRLAQGLENISRKDLGLPSRDAKAKGDFWNIDNGILKRADEVDEILESLSPEELGNWMITGKPPKGKFTQEQLQYVNVYDISSIIDRKTPITYDGATHLWREIGPLARERGLYD